MTQQGGTQGRVNTISTVLSGSKAFSRDLPVVLQPRENAIILMDPKTHKIFLKHFRWTASQGINIVAIETVEKRFKYEVNRIVRSHTDRNDIHVIIAIGGSNAIEVAKGVAHHMKIPKVLCPKIVSSWCNAAVYVRYTNATGVETIEPVSHHPDDIIVFDHKLVSLSIEAVPRLRGDTVVKALAIIKDSRSTAVVIHDERIRNTLQNIHGTIMQYAVDECEKVASGLPSRFEEVWDSCLKVPIVATQVSPGGLGNVHALARGMMLVSRAPQGTRPGKDPRKVFSEGQFLGVSLCVISHEDEDWGRVEDVMELLYKFEFPICLHDLGLTAKDDKLIRFIADTATEVVKDEIDRTIQEKDSETIVDKLIAYESFASKWKRSRR